MPNAPSPALLKGTRVWLTGHGLPETGSTPLLATRLAARWRARPAAAVLLAVFLVAVALIYVSDLPNDTDESFGTDRRWSLLALTGLVAALILAQSLLDRWVRRVDLQAAAALPRRVAHPVRLGWRTVLGVPRAALAVVTFAGTAAIAVGALAEPDDDLRYAAVMLLIGLCGVAVSTLVQLRHILNHPAVADDETSLAADTIMRVEDAREAATPTVVWSLPVVSLLGNGLGWWFTAWLVFVVLGVVALVLINARTARSALAAQRARSAG